MYSRVLAAVDLSPQTQFILSKAKHFIKDTDCDLHLVHVVEPMSVSYGDALVVDFSSVQDQIFQQAEEQLRRLAREAEIPEDHCHTLAGRTELALCECVQNLNADLLLLGAQANNTLRTIFGSTGSGMLRGIPCDLLFIRLDI